MKSRNPRSVSLLLAVLLLFPAVGWPEDTLLDEARTLIQAGRTQDALALLEPFMKRQPDNPEGLLLRSEARLRVGDEEGGRKDLERSLKIDPSQRQGWLNRAGLNIAHQDYDSALEALETARRLDPAATDNDLNIGAVYLLRGEQPTATEHFQRYLREQSSAVAYYLVAVNYAGSGFHQIALRHLTHSIQLDERLRVRAGRDTNLRELARLPEFQTLITTDQHRLAADSHAIARTFGTLPYESEGILLQAVLQTAQVSGRPLDPLIEVHHDWALLWSDARIKIRQLEDGRGRVELTAPRDRFTPEAWKQMSEEFFRKVSARLLILEEQQLRQGG